MGNWLYLLTVLIFFACTSALPTRPDGEEENSEQGEPLLFEPQKEADVNQVPETQQGTDVNQVPEQQLGAEVNQVPEQQLGADVNQVPEQQLGADVNQEVQEDANLLRQADEMNIGRKAPANHGDIGSRTGDEVAHGEDSGSHDATSETQETKHVNTGALSDDFVHNMMHDGKEGHEEADELIRKGRPADIRDVSKMGLSEEQLRGVDKEVLTNTDEGGPIVEDQEHGPTVDQVGKAGDESQRRTVPKAPPRTMDTEQLVHGEGEDHTHDTTQDSTKKGHDDVDNVLTQTFMHDLMHGKSGDHGHDDAELKKSKVIRPRDLLNLGLDNEVLKGLDLAKMIKDDMEEYNRYISEKGGDEESVWNILNSFQFRYFKYGDNIDDISSREPPVEEWEETLVTQRVQHEGEDSIDHMMEVVGDDSPVSEVHNVQHRRQTETEREH